LLCEIDWFTLFISTRRRFDLIDLKILQGMEMSKVRNAYVV